jgi:hypothetical protein
VPFSSSQARQRRRVADSLAGSFQQRRSAGFQNELALVNPSGAIGVSLWNDRQSAKAYNTSTYPQILAKLNPVIVGTPKVETYDVAATTIRA